MARPKKETLEHRKAFELYLSMGPERSLSAVSRRLSKSVVSLQNWSKAFGWASRLEEREKSIAAKTSAKTDESLAEIDAKLINVGKAVLGLFVKRVRGAIDADGNLRPKGYKPSALDAKVWSELMRELVAKGEAHEAGSEGLKIDGDYVEGLGFEKVQRIVLESIERVSRYRKRGDS